VAKKKDTKRNKRSGQVTRARHYFSRAHAVKGGGGEGTNIRWNGRGGDHRDAHHKTSRRATGITNLCEIRLVAGGKFRV